MKHIFYLLITLILTSCGNYHFLTAPSDNITANKLDINKIVFPNSNDSIVRYSLHKKYSYTEDYIFQLEFKRFLFFNFGKYNAIVANREGEILGIVKRVSPNDNIIHLNDFFVFNGNNINHYYNKEGKIVLEKDRILFIDKSLENKQKVKITGNLIFVGQNNTDVFYETNFDNQQIGKSRVKSTHALVKLSPDRVIISEPSGDKSIYLYENENFTMKLLADSIIAYDSLSNNFIFPKYRQTFIPINNSYIQNDTLYFCYNRSLIFSYCKGKLDEIIDLKSLDKKSKVKSFRIYNNRLFYIQETKRGENVDFSENGLKIKDFYSQFKVKDYDVIKIINLDNKEIITPRVVQN